MDEKKTVLAAELFSQMPEDIQDRFITLLQFLLTEQESCPDTQE